VDSCPKGAARFHIKGTKAKGGCDLPRLLFLYPAFLFGGVFATGMISDALYKLLTFIQHTIA
jgi:hypothetical protein